MLFTLLKPMQPLLAAAIPQSSEYLYQVKWDGVRIVAHIGEQRVWLHNRQLNERTAHYPELQKLTELVNGEAILDGEVVAFRQGKPNFALLLKRDLVNPHAAGAAYKVNRLVQEIPVFYLVFDLLYHNGRDLRSLPLVERQVILAEILTTDDTVNLVESFPDGTNLFKAVTEQKMEGVVAKHKNSCYIAGKKHYLWLKIKCRQQQLVAIGGYTMKNGLLNALLVGVYLQDQFIYIGRVATGLSNQDLISLAPYLKARVRKESPFTNLTTATADKKWVTPQLTALVTFQEWTEDLRLRQPVIQGFTKDYPKDCLLS